MNIDAIDAKESRTSGEQSRLAEVRRLAQSRAAERLAGVQTNNLSGNGNSIQQDSVKLSTEALGQVSARNGVATSRRTQQLLSSVLEKLDSQILNPNSDFHQQKAKSAESAKDSKKNKGKQKTEWQPSAKEGQIHHGREVIGKIKVTTEGKGGSNGSGGKVEEFDVKGQAFGVSQTLTMESAKELRPGDKKLGTFRRLDNKPMLKYVTTESRDTKEASRELKKKALAAGETPEAVRKALEMLRDKSQGKPA
jgi:hypothetical protein